jgi:hypothetical protein
MATTPTTKRRSAALAHDPAPAAVTGTRRKAPPKATASGSLSSRTLATAAAEYCEIKAEIKALEAELSPLKPIILRGMKALELDELKTESHVVRVQSRHNWTYSVETENEQLRLNRIKATEQAEGIASDAPTIFPVVTALPS